jgi:hypothetical protein
VELVEALKKFRLCRCNPGYQLEEVCEVMFADITGVIQESLRASRTPAESNVPLAKTGSAPMVHFTSYNRYMPSKKKNIQVSRARSSPEGTVSVNKVTLRILGDVGREGDSYSDIFARLMDLKPKTPIAGYRQQMPKRKPS